MKKTFRIFTCILLLTVISASYNYVNAQRKVYLCESYTKSGQPIGADVEWTMGSGGGGVYILFTNGGDLISWNTIYIMIDRFSGGKYQLVDTKTITPDPAKAWYVYDYNFTEAGSYKVTVSDASGNKLASEYFDIIVKSEQTSTAGNPDAEVIFCLDVDEDINPVDVGTTFFIDPNKGSYIYIYIDHKTPFNTDGLFVDIFKGNDYGEFVDTKSLTIQSQWVATYFKYTFTSAGQYKIIVSYKDQSFMQSGYVTIKYD